MFFLYRFTLKERKIFFYIKGNERLFFLAFIFLCISKKHKPLFRKYSEVYYLIIIGNKQLPNHLIYVIILFALKNITY